jgi:alkylation response protein AidB-like acyl-CoA dehydrogenase
MNGDLMAAFALTEPDAGSDAMNIRTNAVLNSEGTHYIVNGSKQWITNAGWADLFILFAKVNGSDFSAFLLERETPGLTIGNHERLLGLQGSSVCGMQLDNVAIPINNLLGEIGRGHRVALCTLNLGRMKMAANCAGSAKKILETTARYATERRQFGHPLSDFGLIQRKLADMAARAYGTESVAYRTAGLVYSAIETLGQAKSQSLELKLRTFAEFSVECAMAKVIGSESYNSLADEALQIYGGYGFSEEYPAARWYRDSRITRIYEGTSEICRLNIAKTILKRAALGKLSFVDAVGSSNSTPTQTTTDSLEGLKKQVNAVKHLFLFVLGQLWDNIEERQLLDPSNQQFLASLADIAIEIYLAESTVLRVLKIGEIDNHTDRRSETALAQLVFFRSADRIRQETIEILAALLSGKQLEVALNRVNAWLPGPSGLIASRTLVARAVVAGHGTLLPA